MSEIYPKSSFDRFGDDLIELVLSYIPFEDCFHFRCVSKQWKRLIFNKQKDLILRETINDRNNLSDYLYLRKVEIFVKNCPNITSIDFRYIRCIDQILQIVIKYYNTLSEIKVHLYKTSESIGNEFFLKFGSNLKKVDFSYDSALNTLKFCPNVTDLTVREMKDVFNPQNKIYCKKLKAFEFEYRSEDMNRIEVLIENNKRSLETIEVYIFGNKSEKSLKVLFNSLTKLSKLKSLRISGFGSELRKIFINSVKDLAINCKLVKKIGLSLEFINSIEINLKIFQVLKSFVNLKILLIKLFLNEFGNYKKFSITSNELNGLQNLTHLSLNSENLLITDSFFTSIDKYLPKLQSIQCWNTDITEQSFDSLSKLSKLQTIFLSKINKWEINESVLKQLVNKCLKLKSMVIMDNFGFKYILEIRE